MEIKKPQSTTSESSPSLLKRFQGFVEDVKGEVQKITWTSREELNTYTKIVIGATFAFGMAIYGLDLLIQGILSSLNLILNLISG